MQQCVPLSLIWGVCYADLPQSTLVVVWSKELAPGIVISCTVIVQDPVCQCTLAGIMVEPGEQHRKSYNEAFQAFDVLQGNWKILLVTLYVSISIEDQCEAVHMCTHLSVMNRSWANEWLGREDDGLCLLFFVPLCKHTFACFELLWFLPCHKLVSSNKACPSWLSYAVNSPTRKILQWSEGYYAELENRASGNKLEYFFDANGWSPSKLTRCGFHLCQLPCVRP